MIKLFRYCPFFLVMMCWSAVLSAQPGSAVVAVDKPEKYKERMLPAERTGEKRFGLGKRIYQNTVTHYNYYFNAQTKLDQLLEMTGEQPLPANFDSLLPYHPFGPAQTAAFKTELDSVVLKSTAGILLHDLRTDWVDNLYLLMGKAYYYRGDLDSAAWVFQYMNYAFGPKDGDYDLPIGSNATNDRGIFTVSTEDRRKGLKKLFNRPPSRNEALLWLMRVQMEKGDLAGAGSLIQILRRDPYFPKTMLPQLDDAAAYYYYKNELYDSAAYFMVRALPTAGSLMEKSRREFLIAQLYQRSGQPENAGIYYARAASHTLDPVMEVNATLSSVRMGGGRKGDYAQERIEELHKLARKEKYENHRDLIYVTIARAELDRDKKQAAANALNKSLKYSSDPRMKAEAYRILGTLAFESSQFADASRFYDSIDISQFTDSTLMAQTSERQQALRIIAAGTKTITAQDSIQRLAALPEKERGEAIIKLYRKLKSAQGDAEMQTETRGRVASNNPALAPVMVTDLFGTTAKGEFYFNNNSLRSQGNTEFLQRWGDRPNVDNWRRQAAVEKQIAAGTDLISDVADVMDPKNPAAKKGKIGGNAPEDNTEEEGTLSLDGLMSSLPTTPEKLEKSNQKIALARLNSGKAFQYQLLMNDRARAEYEVLIENFPASPEAAEALYHLYILYAGLGNKPSSDSAAKALRKQFPGTEFARRLDRPSTGEERSLKQAGTQAYQKIYDLFLSGSYAQAKTSKVLADSLYGQYYWTPQLLFIEAVHYMHEREDSAALTALTRLTSQFPTSVLSPRATLMMDVLGRRNEIENYLTQLEVTRYEDTSRVVIMDPPTAPVARANVFKADSVALSPVLAPVVTLVTPRADTVAATTGLTAYRFVITEPHYVMVRLTNVDGVFTSEARNALNRYNRTYNAARSIPITPSRLNENENLILLGPFDNAVEAQEYAAKTKAQMPLRIAPWLSADKYEFSMVSSPNFTLLQQLKNFSDYQQFLKTAQPGKW